MKWMLLNNHHVIQNIQIVNLNFFFQAKNETIQECFWCHDERPIFDMLHCGSSDSHKRFCSLTCLSLYRLKQHSHLSNLLHCDNCQKSQPAYYHIKMSDSSVRSFCCYTCVKAFRNKFKVHPDISDPKDQKKATNCENETPSSAQVNFLPFILSELFDNLVNLSGGGCNQTFATSSKTQK